MFRFHFPVPCKANFYVPSRLNRFAFKPRFWFSATAILFLFCVSAKAQTPSPIITPGQITNITTPAVSTGITIDSRTNSAYSLNVDASTSGISGSTDQYIAGCTALSGISLNQATSPGATPTPVDNSASFAIDSETGVNYTLGQVTSDVPNSGIIGQNVTTCVLTNIVDLHAGVLNSPILTVDSTHHLVYTVTYASTQNNNQYDQFAVVDTSSYPALTYKTYSLFSVDDEYSRIVIDPVSGKVFFVDYTGFNFYQYDPSTSTLTAVDLTSAYFGLKPNGNPFLVPDPANSARNLLALPVSNPVFQSAGGVVLGLADFSAITGANYSLGSSQLTTISTTATFTQVGGGIYNPTNNLVYLTVGNATNGTAALESFDVSTPASPIERVVSAIDLTKFAFPYRDRLYLNDAQGSLFWVYADIAYDQLNKPQAGFKVAGILLGALTPTFTVIDGTLLQDAGAEITSFATNPVNGKTYFGTDDSKIFIVSGSATGSLPTTVTLTSSANSATAGQSITLTAAVSPGSGTSVPTGSVTFLDGTSTLATTSVDAQGSATFSTSTLAVGTHSITAQYAGDALYSASTSQPLSLDVSAAGAAATTQLALVPPTSATFGPVNLGVLLTSGKSPTGTVSVSATLNGDSAPFQIVTVDAALASASGGTIATITLNAAGTYTINASYSGDAQNAPSTASPITLVVNKATSTIVLTGPSNGIVGQSLTLNAYLKTSASSIAVTGTAVLTSTVAGNQVTIDSSISGYSLASAAGDLLAVTPSTAGTTVYQLSYSGDSNHLPSSATFTVQVAPQGTFSVVLSDTSFGNAGISQIDSVGDSYNLAITSNGGFNQPLTVSGSGTPSNVQLQFFDGDGHAITSVTPPAGGTVTIHPRFSYKSGHVAALEIPGLPGRQINGRTGVGTKLALCGGLFGMLAGGLFLPFARRKRLLPFVLLALLGVATTGLSGCAVTPRAVATVTITVTPPAGSTQAAIPVTLQLAYTPSY